MKVSELIDELQKAREKKGDLRVTIDIECGMDNTISGIKSVYFNEIGTEDEIVIHNKKY